MTKMTTEQFLSQLGIEVGKEFRTNETGANIYKVISSYELVFRYHDSFDWHKCNLSLSDLLDTEITPLPKYTLTEDDKKLVSLIPSEYKWVYRYTSTGTLIISSNKYEDETTTWFSELEVFDHLLLFVGQEEVSLDELRKCL